MPSRVLLVVVAVLPLAFVSSCSSCDEPEQAPPTRTSPPPPPPTMAVESFRLPSGLEVELVSGPCGEQAAITALFTVGADHDPPSRSGLTHVIERVAQATLDDEERFESARDHTTYSAVVEPGQLGRVLERLAGRLRAPGFDDEAVAQAKTEVLRDLASRRGGDAALTALSFAAESVQPAAGDGWRGGVAAEVETIERAELEAFWRAHFAPRNTRLVVVGRFDAAALRRRIDSAFASLPTGEEPTAREPVEASVTGTIVMGSAPTAVALALPAPTPDDPLFPAFLILASRATSPAEGRTWTAQYDPIREPGALFVTGPVVPGERAEAAANALRADLRAAVVRPFTPADLTTARSRYGLLLGVDELDPETCVDDPRAVAVARVRRAQLGLRELDLAAALEATTEAQLAEASRRFERPAAVLGGGEIR